MPTETIQVFASTTGSSTDAATVDVPMDAEILGIQWAHRADIDGDDENSEAQLSFLSAAQFSTNDARGILVTTRMQAALTTSGVWPMFNNGYTQLHGIEVAAGERLHIHVSASTGVLTQVSFLIILRMRGMGRRQFRRS